MFGFRMKGDIRNLHNSPCGIGTVHIPKRISCAAFGLRICVVAVARQKSAVNVAPDSTRRVQAHIP